jgi:dTDP-4-amino-4,6-dideoxygalactose transaminase
MTTPIPFNRPYVGGREIDYIREALGNRRFSGDGPFTARCSRLLEARFGAPKVLLTTSCTHALEMASLLLDLGPGDEVILPSFTFVSTVNAFVLRGARPVFVDIRPDTLNLDESLVEAALTERTRALFLVHYAGVACEMDSLMALAQKHGLAVVEDAAHAIGASYRGRPLGTFGDLATFSFHETKNVSCGEGGALVINRPELVERAEVIREKGTDRSKFFRGEIDKYGWVDLGSSYLPSELLAAFLLAQLEELDGLNARRAAICTRYRAGLEGAAAAGKLRLLSIPPECTSSHHLFGILLPDGEVRQRVQQRMKAQGIHPTFHYQSLHLSTMGRTFGYADGDLPVTEEVTERLLRLPLFNELTEGEVDRVLAALLGALE